MTPSRLLKIGQKHRAKKYERKEGNVIAILQVKNSVYVGVNSRKTSPQLSYCYPDGNSTSTHHAEMAAIARKNVGMNPAPLSGARLYVMRFMNDGSVGNSKPCLNCQKYLRSRGIKARNIWYSNDSGSMERMNEYDH